MKCASPFEPKKTFFTLALFGSLSLNVNLSHAAPHVDVLGSTKTQAPIRRMDVERTHQLGSFERGLLHVAPTYTLDTLTKPFEQQTISSKDSAGRLVSLELTDTHAFNLVSVVFDQALGARIERARANGSDYFFSSHLRETIINYEINGGNLFKIFAAEKIRQTGEADKVTVKDVVEFAKKCLYEPSITGSLLTKVTSKNSILKTFSNVVNKPVELNSGNLVVLFHLIRARMGSSSGITPIRPKNNVDFVRSTAPESIIEYLERALQKGYTYGQVINDIW